MKLSSVTVITSASTQTVFGVREYDEDCRYLVKGIVGIDADDLVPKFYGFGLSSGKKMYEYTMEPRDIVMRVILNPMFRINEGVGELRDELYRLVSPDRVGELNVQFNSGGVISCAINGRVTKLEAAHFSKVPEVQITIHCDDPMFRSIAPIDIAPADLPSTNPVKLTDQPATAPHGFVFKVKFTAVTSTFVIQDDPTTPDWRFEVTPATSFQIDDELHVSSEYGNKRVFWNKAVGTDIDLMDKVSFDSVWPQIFPGLNELYFMQIANFDWLEVSYNSAFWGL